jgi:hypothetical protein
MYLTWVKLSTSPLKRGNSSFIVSGVVRRDEEQWDPLDSLGKSGEAVARNVRRLRKSRGQQYTELAVKLQDLGREIPTWGLRKIESGGRRVDADDLVALALALDVSPISLLVPIAESGEDDVEITGLEAGVEARRVWRWLQAASRINEGTYAEFLTFVNRAIPPWRQPEVVLVESGVGTNLTRFVREQDDDYGDDQ